MLHCDNISLLLEHFSICGDWCNEQDNEYDNAIYTLWTCSICIFLYFVLVYTMYKQFNRCQYIFICIATGLCKQECLKNIITYMRVNSVIFFPILSEEYTVPEVCYFISISRHF